MPSAILGPCFLTDTDVAFHMSLPPSQTQFIAILPYLALYARIEPPYLYKALPIVLYIFLIYLIINYSSDNHMEFEVFYRARMSTERYKVVTVSLWACTLQAMELSSLRPRPLTLRLAKECRSCKFVIQPRSTPILASAPCLTTSSAFR